MKRLLCLAMAFLMLMGLSITAFATDLGVQVIGGPEAENGPVSLDDIKLNAEATIEGYAIFLPTAYTVQDVLGYYRQGRNNPDDNWHESGQDADYVILHVDITNLALNEKKFSDNASVKVVFDEPVKSATPGQSAVFYDEDIVIGGGKIWQIV